MDKRGMNVPKASGSRTGNLLAGLGKMVVDNFSGKRQLMLDQAREQNRANIDVDRRGKIQQTTYEILQRAAADPNFQDKEGNLLLKDLSGVGGFQAQAIVQHTKGTPKPGSSEESTPPMGESGNTKGPQFGQPTTEDTAPTSSTSEMKQTKVKKQTVGVRKSTKKAAPKSTAPEKPKVSGSKTKKVSAPKAAPKAAPMPKPIGKAKNGNVKSANGNKKGGM